MLGINHKYCIYLDVVQDYARISDDSLLVLFARLKALLACRDQWSGPIFQHELTSLVQHNVSSGVQHGPVWMCQHGVIRFRTFAFSPVCCPLSSLVGHHTITVLSDKAVMQGSWRIKVIDRCRVWNFERWNWVTRAVAGILFVQFLQRGT